MSNVPTPALPPGRPASSPCYSTRWTARRSLTVSVPPLAATPSAESHCLDKLPDRAVLRARKISSQC